MLTKYLIRQLIRQVCFYYYKQRNFFLTETLWQKCPLYILPNLCRIKPWSRASDTSEVDNTKAFQSHKFGSSTQKEQTESPSAQRPQFHLYLITVKSLKQKKLGNI